ncbi:cell division protein FtsB [Allocatelliglobosispora scoriae]|uniref:Cell division protein FtsB n=1 Tax=Allocatelliglobosispora scoriae TaxID=643052 RepID=A0A841BSL4_9ACTN|nr:septum formation initiator family protein [Allocatelliglobosispora scoriae]MBB5870386.1 cell division protein FtsB [Allocatelliglobosispora scoriae]
MTQRRTPSGQGPARRSGARTSVRSRALPGTRVADPSRSANRPAAARRAAAAGAAARTSAPAERRLTGRATVLVVVLVALALGYAYPVRVYLTQQSEIESMQAAQEAQRAHIRDLEATAAKWQDDEYVRIQARSRLFYVRPGEIPLVTLWDQPGADRDAGIVPGPKAPEPWYSTLWASVGAANE